jgi:malto-oligosyltrehalose trehalohydrolase
MMHCHSMPFGTEVLYDGSVRFRLWAPAAGRVDLCLEDSGVLLPMTAVDESWFELVTAEARAGSYYRFCIDGNRRVPDPASRYNPMDVHGPSAVIDPYAFVWEDRAWPGRLWEEAVIYELHVGTFTPEGTFKGVRDRLDYLVELGITALELMPVADFPGTRNWGYDGVLPFAPDSSYGHPDDLKDLIQTAHKKGLMVFLDVVYNHFGPEGNYLHTYAPQFFSEHHHTPWGAAINFDGPGSRVVRDFFIHNALYWLEEFHLDGLRLDAVHAITDDSTPDILEELAAAVQQKPGGTRHIHLVLENDHNASHYLKRGYRAQWNDDIHHALHILVTGERDGYYVDYVDKPVWYLGRCLTEGFAYQGESSAYRGGVRRGEPSRDLPPTAFVSFLQNHDQVGNRAFGERIGMLASPGPSRLEVSRLEASQPEGLRAAIAVLLLSPSPPLLFMGEEFGAAQPFQFFCDFGPELAAAVTEGRREEFARFEKFTSPAERTCIPDPNARSTFERAKLDWDSVTQPPHAQWLNLYRHLLALRQREIVPRLLLMQAEQAQFRVLGERALAANWRLSDGAVLTLLTNLGGDAIDGMEWPGGGVLYATEDRFARALADHVMPPWSTAWFLEPGRPPHPALSP